MLAVVLLSVVAASAGAWYVGMVEFPISGANFNILVDGVLTSSDARQLAPGPHTYDAELVTGAQSAEGSIAVAHS